MASRVLELADTQLSNGYNMVLHKRGDRLYEGLTDTLKAHLRGVAAKVEEAHGAAFLPALRAHWQNHNKSMQMIRCERSRGVHAALADAARQRHPDVHGPELRARDGQAAGA